MAVSDAQLEPNGGDECGACARPAPAPIAITPEPTPARGETPAPAPEPFLLRTWWASGALFVAGLLFFFAGQLVPGIGIGVWIAIRDGAAAIQDPKHLETALVGFLPLLVLFSPLSAIALVLLLKATRQLAPDPASAALKPTLLLTVLGCAAAFAGSIGISWLQKTAGVQVEEQAIMKAAFAGGTTWDLALAVVLFAPLGEELMFRRFGYGTLRVRYGRAFAALVTCLVFSAIHMNPAGSLLYAWLGLCCAVVYERTGRTSCAVAVHAFNNAIALLANGN